MKVRPGTGCTYCGVTEGPFTKDHVIPSNLYPLSRGSSRVQRITVPACVDCNNDHSDDEAHFRNVILIAGEPNEAVRELWDSEVSRSFSKNDGAKRVHHLAAQMKPVVFENQNRFMIYPYQDPSVVRVLRKIVRGLSSYHGLDTAVSEDRVLIRPGGYSIPESIDVALIREHREQDILRYAFCPIQDGDLSSFWHLIFFDRTDFFAVITRADGSMSSRGT
jgi:hypothetical protein